MRLPRFLTIVVLIPLALASACNRGAHPKQTNKPAPDFTVSDGASTVHLATYRGSVVLLNFWATFCGPCKMEMPWFQDLVAKYQPQGVVMLGIDQDDGMATPQIAAASKEIGVRYPILLPDNKIAKDYQLSDYLPETYYIDKSGKVVDQTIGAHSKDELEADIQKAIGSGGQ